MLSTIAITFETLLLGGAILAYLVLLGFGVAELLLPAGGLQLAIAPVIGLCILELGFAWMNFVAPPYVAAVVLLVALAPLSAVRAWRTRSALLAAWRDLAGAGAVAAVFFVSLLQVVIERGAFTLGSFPGDNIFIYVQAAQFLRDHPVPANLHAAAVSNPGSYYLTSFGPSFPNTVGAIDAAASALSGLPVHVLFDPLSAIGLALTIGPIWYMVREDLGGSWPTAAAAASVMASSQLLYWVFGVGLQQESLALPMLALGFAVLPRMLRSGDVRAGALLGLVEASLAGLYLPIAVLLGLCATGALLVSLLVTRSAWRSMVKPVAIALATGAAGSLGAAYVLLFNGGLSLWVSIVGTRVAAGNVSTFPPLPYLLGTLPFVHVWELSRTPLGRLDRILWPALIASSALLFVLLIAGVARAVLQRRAVEVGLVVTGFLFILYEAAVAQYAYGFLKSVGYMIPLTSVFVGFGAVGIAAIVPRHWRRAAEVAGVAAAAIVLLGSVNATRDMLHLWLQARPALDASDLQTARLDAVVPVGATVLIDQPGTDYSTLIRAAAIAYFLPDRNVRVFIGTTRLGTFQGQDVLPPACEFEYVVSAGGEPSGFSLVYADPSIGLYAYRRTGPACSAGPG